MLRRIRNMHISIRTVSVLLSVAVLITALTGYMVFSAPTPYVGDLTDIYFDPPLNVYQLIVGEYNSTYFYVKNGTTGQIMYLFTVRGDAVNNASDILHTTYGTCYVKYLGGTASGVVLHGGHWIIDENAVVTYTVDSDHGQTIEDLANGQFLHYQAGVLTYAANYTLGDFNLVGDIYCDYIYAASNVSGGGSGSTMFPSTYLIIQSGSTYYSYFGANGSLAESSTIAAQVINNAIKNCSGTVGTVISLRGNFNLTNQGSCKGTAYSILINKDKVILDLTQAKLVLDASEESTLIMVDDPLIMNSTDASYEEAITEVGILGGYLDCNKDEQTSAGNGILFNYTRKGWIRDTYIVDAEQDDLVITGYYNGATARFSVEDDFYNLKLYTADSRGLYSIDAADNHFENIYIQKSNAEGAYIYSSSSQFVNLHIYDCCLTSGQAGLRVNGDNNHFWHSESDKPTTRAIYLDSGADGNIFTDTWIFDLDSSSTYTAVTIVSSEYVIFNGGRIQDGNLTETGTCNYNIFTDLIVNPDYIRTVGANTQVHQCFNSTAEFLD